VCRNVVPSNSNITLSGYMDKQLPYHTTVAMVSITEGSIVPSDLDISGMGCQVLLRKHKGVFHPDH
jgi:hypothetical protein